MCLITVVLMLLATCFSSSSGSLTSTPPANLTTSFWAVGFDQLILTGTAQIALGTSVVVLWKVNDTNAIVFESPDGINPSECKGTVSSTFGEANCSLQGNIVTSSFKFTALTSTLLVALSAGGVDQSATIQVISTSTVVQHCRSWSTNYTGDIDSFHNISIPTNKLSRSSWRLDNIEVASCTCYMGKCADLISILPFTITCVVDKTTNTSYATVLSSRSGLPSFASCAQLILAVDSSIYLNKSFTVSNCPDVLMWSVNISSSAYNYMSKGKYYCDNGGELFYSNGSRRNSNLTHCLEHATWSGQENLQCWLAPIINLSPSTISGTEGTYINISCSETKRGFPSIQYYDFYFGTYSIRSNNSRAQICLKREWDGKKAYCQAVSDFTIHSQTSSISNHSNVTVYYKPVAVSHSELVCEWSKNQQDARCDVPFYSNPSPAVTSLYKDEVDLTGSYYHLLNTDVQDRYKFSLRRRTVLKEDYGQYIVTVSNSLYKGTLKFSVVQPTSSQVNVGVIVGSVFGSLAAVALIAFSVYFVQRHQAERTKEGNPDASPPPVVYNNVPVKEAEQSQDQSRDNQDTPNQQAAQTNYENVHHYEAIGSNKQAGGEDPYIDLNV